MKYASLGPIAIHLPARVETNQALSAEFPHWNMEAIFAKTGIRSRPIADRGQCASDLGVAAAEKLFAEHQVQRDSIDFLLFCTQTPDYPLPTTACLVQNRLGLPTAIGALDFNLGCSGFVYGLSLADGLIRSGSARRVLLITAETYSRYIDPTDRSLRPIFADGAAATLVEAADEPSLGHFQFGTDGRGGEALMVAEGGARAPEQSLRPKKRRRWPSSLYMDGPELVRFTLDVVPPMVGRLLAESHLRREDIDFYLMHQATLFMLENLRAKLALEADSVPNNLEERGNTVSSTLPILVHDLRTLGRLRPGKQSLLIGFGVGLSWAGCTWRETWQGEQFDALAGEQRRAA
jgi:3-oxoacyl-[acyl-carrier-protein] synthase-3